jgi:hypothetical protein
MLAGMAQGVLFAIHRARKEAALFWFDERTAGAPLPAGWESLQPRALIQDKDEFEAWLALSPEARLERLAPPGFRIVTVP